MMTITKEIGIKANDVKLPSDIQQAEVHEEEVYV